MTNEEFQTIDHLFGKIESLPTIPSVALEVSMLAENPSSSLAEIALVIQRDPSIASKLLKIANSAFYGYSKRVNNLQSALMILGLRETKNMVLGLSIINLFKKSSDRAGLNYQLFWMHSAACAQIARSLAFRMGLFDLEQEAFTIGLIHDIGKLVIDQFRPNDFLNLIQLIQEEHLSFVEAEQRFLGVDHARIGSWLARRWLFPQELIEAIEYHHEPSKSQNSPILAALVNVADIFCKSKELAFMEEFKGELINDNKGWKIIQESSPRRHISFDIERFTFGLDEEILKAQQFINISRGIDI